MRGMHGWMLGLMLCCAAGMAGAEEPAEARLREAQTAFDEARTLWDGGRYAEAIATGEHALALREAVLGGAHPDVATSLDWLGSHHLLRGNPVRAEPLLQRALAIREAALGKNHLEVAQMLNTLGKLQSAQLFVERARPLHERALAIREAALGKDHPLVAESLNELASLYIGSGSSARAEPLFERALAIREAALGRNHPAVAQTLCDFAGFFLWKGLHSRAQSLLERSLTIREGSLGKSHPLVAESILLLDRSYRGQGMYARTRPLLPRALAIREAALRNNPPDVAESLDNLATLYEVQQLFARAEPLRERALAIREADLGESHPLVAVSLVDRAGSYHMQGAYGPATPLYGRALAIFESALGRNHPFVAPALTELAHIYQDQGLYDRARPLYERALAIREAVYGEGHFLVAISHYALANVHVAQGMYGQAEPLYERALTILESVPGRNDPLTAVPLHELANLYMAQGLYDQARLLSERALAIREAAHGEGHGMVAFSLNQLANVHVAQGMYSQAEPLYARTLTILESIHGKQNYLVARPLHDLANLYVAQGLYRRARPLHARALAIREASLGKNNPDVARSLNHLAGLYSAQGLYRQACPLYERALAIQEVSLGRNHPDVAATLNHLAVARLAGQGLDEALPLLTRAFAISERRLRQEALGFSEARLGGFLQLLRTDEERLYALLRAHPGDARVRRLVLGAALLLKGRSVEESADISRAVYRSLGAQDRGTFERLRELRTQLASLSHQGHGSLPPATYRQRLEELSEQSVALEADLARRSAPLRALAALPSLAEIVDRVAAALPGDAALVEFITYVDRPLVLAPGAPGSQRPSEVRYLALVLFPDGSIRFRDLGPAAPVDSAASHLRDALANRDTTFQASAQALYQLAFQPLLPLLGTTRRLFLSPDGQLALVPFAALHDGHQYLVDGFDFTYVSSGRSLLPRPQERVPPASVVVLADPDFSAASLPALPASGGEAAGLATRSVSGGRFSSTLHAHLEERAWTPTPLPGTRQEARAIQRLLPEAQLFLGAEATRQRLLQLPAPGILHLATHGFFLEDAPQPPASRAVAHFGALGEDAVGPGLHDPLLRSGLVLAGASAPAHAGSSTAGPPADSALVTALELAGLDLWGTQLVVLSACDTGRGDVKLGQGVYGLRRAFLVAGAETVVMSLWKVNDETTSTLMEAYYRQLLAGQGRATALREAMLALRLAQAHPHYWAPFIAMGSDAPLRALAPIPQQPLDRGDDDLPHIGRQVRIPHGAQPGIP
ncbi:CHAT domain-containing tetratricopeptide repeat protein [Pyxidicoccus caerfyrddinensis]|uniref:CHAT domain-containing tetratricopeptide repeat protein n=1 Tax=Pyxidicoccus caerfyrddinensis TaxID=2709663 RepID=UPI001F07A8D7|nr:CHAT domain-containing protein [Pyxidicoccus caerfyrddinensis]